MFGTLQHSTFPVYFNLSILLTGGLLGLWGYGHPAVLQSYAEPQLVDVAQAYTLGSVILVQAANQFIIGPMTSKYVRSRPLAQAELMDESVQNHVPAS